MRGLYLLRSAADRGIRGTRHVTAAFATCAFPAKPEPFDRGVADPARGRALVERQELRIRGASDTSLERNRLQIARAQWELGHALIDRHLSDAGVASLGPVRAELDKRAMAALSAGHFATDFANGALPALLPFFVDRFDLSVHAGRGADARLGGFVLADPAALRSVVRPARRALAAADRSRGCRGRDRARRRLAVVLARCCCSSSSRASGSPRTTRRARSSPPTPAGRKRASGMSLFSIGGNVGYALGPDRRRRRWSLAFGLTRRPAARGALPRGRGAAARASRRYLRGFAPERGRAPRDGRARPAAARSRCSSA